MPRKQVPRKTTGSSQNTTTTPEKRRRVSSSEDESPNALSADSFLASDSHFSPNGSNTASDEPSIQRGGSSSTGSSAVSQTTIFVATDADGISDSDESGESDGEEVVPESYELLLLQSSPVAPPPPTAVAVAQHRESYSDWLKTYRPGSNMDSTTLTAACCVIDEELDAVATYHSVQFDDTIAHIPFDVQTAILPTVLATYAAHGTKKILAPLHMDDDPHYATAFITLGATPNAHKIEYAENLDAPHHNLETAVAVLRSLVGCDGAPQRLSSEGAKISSQSIQLTCGVCVINNYFQSRMGRPLHPHMLLKPREISNIDVFRKAVRREAEKVAEAMKMAAAVVGKLPKKVGAEKSVVVQGAVRKKGAKATPEKEKKTIEHVHTFKEATPPQPTPKKRAAPYNWLRICGENHNVRSKCSALENQLEIANAALAQSLQRETNLRRLVLSQHTQIRTLRGGGKKADTGRPRKLGARDKPPFTADLRGIPPHQWSPQLLSIVRFLHKGLVQGDIDLRCSEELRRCLRVDPRVWKNIVDTTGPIEPKPRKKSPQQHQHERIIEALNAILPTLPYRTTDHIQNALSQLDDPIGISKSWLRKLLRKRCVLRSLRTAPALRPGDLEARKAFADLYRPKPGVEPHPDLGRLVFSDECRFSDNVGAHRVWCLPGETPPQLGVPRESSIMMWLCIGDFGPKKYVGGHAWYAPGSTQDSEAYVETLKTVFQPLAARVYRARQVRLEQLLRANPNATEEQKKKWEAECKKLILQQDGAPTHTSTTTKEYFAEVTDFEVLTGWPARSPDLNPIENMWGWLKTNLKYLPPGNRSVEAVRLAIEELLESEKANEIARGLLESFQSRCQQVYDNDGDAIPY